MIESLIAGAIASGTSVLYGIYGETFSERVGVINLGMEGIMIIGAVTSYIGTAMTGNPWIGVLIAMLCGGLLAALHAIFVIERGANQLATGLTIMFLGLGLAAFFGRDYVSVSIEGFPKIPVPYLSAIPVIGQVFNQDILVYIALLLSPILYLVLFKTKFGMQFRGTGENIDVVYAYGVKAKKMKYYGVVLGGMLTAIGGAQLSIAYTHSWIEGMTNGRGIIAVALVVLAGWNPGKAIIGAFIFGGAQSLQMILQQQGVHISVFLLNMLPYVLTLIALLIASKRKNQSTPAELRKIIESCAS